MMDMYFGALVAEVPDPGEDHGKAKTVRGFDYFWIADRTTGLDDRSRTDTRDFFDSIWEREEGIGGDHCTFQRKNSFHSTDFSGIDTAHLSRTDADRLSVAGV